MSTSFVSVEQGGIIPRVELSPGWNIPGWNIPRMEHPHPNPLGTECLDPRELREALGGFAALTQYNHNELLVLSGV